MESYADSRLPVSLFRRDEHSAAANRHMARTVVRLPFNPLHRLEVRNAVRFGVRRGGLREDERRTALAQMDTDLREGSLAHSPIPWTDALRRAEVLSGAKTFLSFDANQRALAKTEGLAAKP